VSKTVSIPSGSLDVERVVRRSPQGNIELMSEKQVLGFKPAPRLEQVDEEHCE
jgi:hypothetical protein